VQVTREQIKAARKIEHNKQSESEKKYRTIVINGINIINFLIISHCLLFNAYLRILLITVFGT